MMGRVVADEVAKAFPDGAKIGMIYFDATYKLVNEREAGFEEGVADHPNLEIVTKSPMADPFATEEIATAMIARYPDLDVIFAPWDLPAEGVVAALRGAGREDIKVATIDLGFTGAYEIATDGLIFVESSQLVYDWGRVGCMAAALKLLGEEVPPYTIVPVFSVTKENLVEGWYLGFGGKVTLPPEVLSEVQ
jgi:ribose transport system substrate-binding protein